MIIFDCDGVLVDSESVYIATELSHLADVGVHYDRAHYVRRSMGLTPERWRTELAADLRATTGAQPQDGSSPSWTQRSTARCGTASCPAVCVRW